MLDIVFIRENKELVKKGANDKGCNPKAVDEVLLWDEKRRRLIGEVEVIRQERNKLNEKLKKGKDEKLIKKSVELKRKLQDIEPELKKTQESYNDLLSQIPNPPADDVKVGKDESGNEVLRKWGKKKNFSFKVKDHFDLGENLGIIDVKRAVRVSGSRFSYLKGDAVRLEFGLINFAMDKLVKKGFVPVVPPVLIKKESMKGMGYIEHGGIEEMYVLERDDMVLVGTSEQSIGPMHKDEVVNGKDLPLRYVGFSTCFRREAGTYGKDMKGILRMHQFDKVEMFSFTKPGDSDKEHDFLLNIEEELYRDLEIPYQVIKMCSGDLGAPASRKYDIEAWLPSQNKHREVTSTSNTTDFQSRRLNMKYQDKGKVGFVHTLNGTAFAIGRTIIAILENYQQKDGSIVIPKVLQKYMGKKVLKKKKN